MAGRRLASGLIRQGAAALTNTVNGKRGAAIGGELGEVFFRPQPLALVKQSRPIALVTDQQVGKSKDLTVRLLNS
jgi:hypothetical protein